MCKPLLPGRPSATVSELKCRLQDVASCEGHQLAVVWCWPPELHLQLSAPGSSVQFQTSGIQYCHMATWLALSEAFAERNLQGQVSTVEVAGKTSD